MEQEQEPAGEKEGIPVSMDFGKGVFRLRVSCRLKQGQAPDITRLKREAERNGGAADLRIEEDRAEICVLLYAGLSTDD